MENKLQAKPARGRMWRKAAILATVLLLILATMLTLSSCGKREVPIEEYTITYPYGVSDEVFAAILTLREAIREETGIRLKYKDDFANELLGETVPTDTKEILIGRTNRAESRSYDLGRDDTAIYFENGRLVITGGSDAAVIKAIETYIAEYLGEGKLEAPRRAVIERAEYPYRKVTLGGVSIHDYCIIYTVKTRSIALRLQGEIAEATGAVLDVYPTSKVTGTDREILVGDFTGDRATEAVSAGYRIEMLGNRLSLRGAGEDGAYAALMAFIGDLAGSGRKLTLSYDTAKTGDVTDMSFFTLNLSQTLGDMSGKYDISFSTETVMDRFFATKDELPEEVSVIERVSLDDYPLSLANVVYVSPNGDDTAKGTEDAPLKTLERALERMKNAGGGVIFMMGGTYSVTETVALSDAHSGARQAPLFIKALDGAEVKLSSQKPLDVSDGKWSYVDASDSIHASVYDRIPEEALDHLVYTTLDLQGMKASDIPAISKSGPGRMYVGGEEYQLAQYPNKTIDPNELLYFNHVYDQGKVTGTSTNLYPVWQSILQQNGYNPADEHGWEFRVVDPRDGYTNHSDKAQQMKDEITSWVNTGDIWIYGSTFEGWEFGYYNLALTTKEHGVTKHWGHNADGTAWQGPDSGKTPYLGTPKSDGYYSLKSAMSNTLWGCKTSANSAAGRNTFYLFNAIEALDAPGEWYFEKTTGVLYLYPKTAHEELAKSQPAFSNSEAFHTMEIDKASNIVLDGLTFDGASKRGLYVNTCDSVIVQNCTFKNSADTNMTLYKSTNSAVIYSDFSMAYNTMLAVSDSRSTYAMDPCNNVIQNNIFHDPAPLKQGGITWSGCRLVVSHNYFNNTNASGSNGVECILEYNLFEGGSKDITDGGMIYESGSSCRANHYRYNLFHMFNATHNAVYNDTMGSGNYMYYNIVSTLHSGADHNKPWYSSTGWGNVSFGNLTVLRTPIELRDAGSKATVETEGFTKETQGDVFNESGLFYYYFSDAHGAGGAAARYQPVDYEGNTQIPVRKNTDNSYSFDYSAANASGGQYLSQSLAGHWWPGIKRSDTNIYLTRVDLEGWKARMPEYINMMYGTKLIVDLYDDVKTGEADLAGRVQDFHIKYFYIPWYLATDEGGARKTYTYGGLPEDVVITIPEYTYLETVDGKLRAVTVPEHIHEARNEDGSITLTYEEIAAMERARRAPQYSVVSDNIILGSSPKYEKGAGGKLYPIDEPNPSSVITNTTVSASYVKNEVQARGLMITTEIKDNYMVYDYSAMMPNAYTFSYEMTDAAWDGIRASNTVDADVVEVLKGLSTSLYEKCGPTYQGFDATEYFNTVYPDFDWDKAETDGFYWTEGLD